MDFPAFIILVAVCCLVIGAGLGLAGYRYALKRNPEKLEAWARGIKIARENAERKLKGNGK